MKNLVAFFEIPATDFQRAVKFYQTVFKIEMQSFECDTEKMAFFADENGVNVGAISWAKGFNPSKDGVLVSLTCEDITSLLPLIKANGGTIAIPKTKIEAEGRGYFATFTDTEGNRLGLYSDK